jgi:hypothetical protein
MTTMTKFLASTSGVTKGDEIHHVISPGLSMKIMSKVVENQAKGVENHVKNH